METIAFSGPFVLDRSRHAAVQVYEYLREEIVNLTLKPGTLLSRTELSAHFDLSVTPIRDALMRLEEEGLVDIYPQHATRVRGISIASARQAHFLRLAIELEIVRTLAGKDDAALNQTLQSLVLQQKAALKARDLDSFSRVDHAFHRQLYSAAEVEELWRLMRHRSGNMDRLRRLHLPLNGKSESILKDHAAIAGAIARGDAAAAEAALRRHLSGTLSELDALRTQYPDYWTPGPD
ncbi:GntR family transcriptional regulator [Massilia sp. X63]|uniref:GntR family transcriptional regulator n=1 Tax=Massilia sp. X63 TaxID=3237285 RepID=UPI0034DD3780